MQTTSQETQALTAAEQGKSHAAEVKKPARPVSNKRAASQAPLQPSSDRMMRIDEVIQITGLGKTSIYKLGSEGKFPPRIKISARAVAWSKNAVDGWLGSFNGGAA